MPARCAVAGCSNTNKKGVAVHKFPKENKLKAQWTRFVKLTRADFTQPTQYQTICEDHFTSDCYDQKYKIKQTLGFSEKCKKTPSSWIGAINLSENHKRFCDYSLCTPPTKNLDGTDHFYDIWHVSKGLKKKMLTLSKEKDCENVSSWIKSIINHLYWSAASTENGNGDVMWAKWESVCNHVQNIHKGNNQLFPECLHAVGLQRKWLLPGTKVCERLTDLLTTNQVKRDVKKLSPIYQTSSIEAYHSVINHFAPKMIGFSFHGMYCRLLIAAIHYNENNSREQASTRDGLLKYDVIFPKYKKGDYIVRECKKSTSYGYVKRLVSYAAEKCESQNRTRIDVNVPPPLCSTYFLPQKEEAVKMKTSRFPNK